MEKLLCYVFEQIFRPHIDVALFALKGMRLINYLQNIFLFAIETHFVNHDVSVYSHYPTVQYNISIQQLNSFQRTQVKSFLALHDPLFILNPFPSELLQTFKQKRGRSRGVLVHALCPPADDVKRYSLKKTVSLCDDEQLVDIKRAL